MKRNNPQFLRQMEIDRRVRAGEYPSVPNLAADLEVNERTIKRDIEFMRDSLHAPIKYDRNRCGYFYSESNWSLPAISLREGELVALLLAKRALEQYDGLPLADMLHRFYGQLLQMAGDHVGASVEQITECFSFIPPPSVPVDSNVWNILSQSLLKSHTVELVYQSVSAESERTYRMDPLHIVNIEGEWYLFSRSHYKGDVMQLAISRIRSAEDTGIIFQPLESWGLGTLKELLFGRYASMQGKSENVRVVVDAAYASQVYLKQWHEKQTVSQQDDGAVEISFPVSSGSSKQPYGNVISWVLGMGSHAKVLAPARLKKMIAEEIAALSAQYKS